MSFVTEYGINLSNALKYLGFAVCLGVGFFIPMPARAFLFSGVVLIGAGWAFGKVVGK